MIRVAIAIIVNPIGYSDYLKTGVANIIRRITWNATSICNIYLIILAILR